MTAFLRRPGKYGRTHGRRCQWTSCLGVMAQREEERPGGPWRPFPCPAAGQLLAGAVLLHTQTPLTLRCWLGRQVDEMGPQEDRWALSSMMPGNVQNEDTTSFGRYAWALLGTGSKQRKAPCLCLFFRFVLSCLLSREEVSNRGALLTYFSK